MDILLLLYLSCFILSIIVGFLGKSRSCGFLIAFIISVLFTPVIGILVVLCCKRKKTEIEALSDLEVYKANGMINDTQYERMKADIQCGIIKPLDYYTNIRIFGR